MTEAHIQNAPVWWLEEQIDLIGRRIQLAARGIGVTTIQTLHERLKMIENRLSELGEDEA